MQYQDYYKTLGVERNADEDTIKKSYRKLAMQYHPDRNPGNPQAEDHFKQINEAYQVLSDPQKRARYDQLGQSYNQWQQRGGTPTGFDFSEWFTQSGGGQNMGDTFGQGDVSDFFASIFGGMRGGTSNFGFGQRSRKPSQHTPAEISLTEACTGTVRRVEVDGKRLEVKIPAGAHTGTKVRVADAITTSDGRKGDLFLDIEVQPDARFERDGSHLITHANVGLFTAVLGGEVKVPTPTGNIMLTIPPGTQPDQTFRLGEQGIPHLHHPEKRGDLLVKIKVKLPRSLTPEQKRLFEQLADLEIA
jgi:curved DNA-binding protein